MTDLVIYTEALMEAYAAAPNDQVVLATLEFRHGTFVDEDDNPIAIRMVQDAGEIIEERDDGPDIRGLMLGLEATAPMDPGDTVLFQSVMFQFVLPEQSESKVTGMQVKFDNVTKIMSKYLDAAVKLRSPMALIYREYLKTDLTVPQLVIANLSIKSVSSTVFQVTADANFLNFLDKKFPNKEYRPEDFPGLVA